MRFRSGPKPAAPGVSLLDHLKALIEENRALTDAKFITYRAYLDSNAEKVALALAAADKAIDAEKRTTNERLTLLNELRSGVATLEQLSALSQRFEDLKERLDKLEGKAAGTAASWTYLIGAVTLVGGVVAIIIGTR